MCIYLDLKEYYEYFSWYEKAIAVQKWYLSVRKGKYLFFYRIHEVVWYQIVLISENHYLLFMNVGCCEWVYSCTKIGWLCSRLWTKFLFKMKRWLKWKYFKESLLDSCNHSSIILWRITLFKYFRKTVNKGLVSFLIARKKFNSYIFWSFPMFFFMKDILNL